MKHYLTVILLATILLTACCRQGDRHLIQDTEYRELVHTLFLKQRELALGRDSALFSVFDGQLTRAETEGLEFLYAFMPLSDLAMNDGEYNLKQVRSALEAQAFFNWGKQIPEKVFLHFVLPYRVNNEYTDTARQVFLKELKDRIKGMGMAEAALEVNHWCHEKVNYKSTDERTSGPLTSVRTAFGRCGEESTFTVAALRAVGIPARQVYTPRWAHTDDNHAWVEIWVDGKWHFMGACEPEPALDMAWFAEPVKRAMMTHTFVYGQYMGDEEVLEKNDRFTRLNLLRNYTETRIVPVRVNGVEGKPVENVKVEYSLYNYAEFYPIATRYTDKVGFCDATTGFGDLMVWASKDGLFGHQVVKASDTDTIVINLNSADYKLRDQLLTLIPPARKQLPPADQSKTESNNRRLKQEDSIRNAYIATFIDSVSAVKIATGKGLDGGEVWGYLMKSRGNWKEIADFMNSFKSENSASGMALLANISEKDLHDIRASVLNDHLNAFGKYPAMVENSGKEYIDRYVLSPRIGREFVTEWRSWIQQFFTPELAESFRNNPGEIVNWVSDHILLDSVSNYYNVPINPEGVMQLKRSDRYSRDVLFVAICRSFGIPSRLEPATRVPQFFHNGSWNEVRFSGRIVSPGVKGNILLENDSDDKSFIPQYYIHYTLARLDKGRFITLDYELDESLKSFPCNLKVDTGYYRLLTGNRQADGSVVCSISYFRVRLNETARVKVSLASEKQQSGVLGKADMEAGFRKLQTGESVKLADFTAAKGMVIAIIDPGKEPTRHLMEDIKAVKSGLDSWGGQFLFLVAKEKLSPGFDQTNYKGLPLKSVFGSDEKGDVSSSVSTVCSIQGIPQYPVVVFISGKGEIVWHSEGYSIGLGDQLMKQIKESGK
ncbi:MAG: transglutaminase domain-containing protein [Bacteroidales bacterium]|nr:transglutaminase domain-containing protein [Bacteroidales bacterium]